MTIYRKILGTSLVVLAAIIRCHLSEELRWVPSRVATATMATAQLLALARRLALARFANYCNRNRHDDAKRKRGLQTSSKVHVAPCPATALKARAQISAAMTHAKAWLCTRLTPKGPELLVIILALGGSCAVRVTCDVFGQPSLLMCSCIIWPMALLTGGVAYTFLPASPHEPVQSTCFCARQGGSYCTASKDCPYRSEFWAPVVGDATEGSASHSQ